jgi:hypothetical protein
MGPVSNIYIANQLARGNVVQRAIGRPHGAMRHDKRAIGYRPVIRNEKPVHVWRRIHRRSSYQFVGGVAGRDSRTAAGAGDKAQICCVRLDIQCWNIPDTGWTRLSAENHTRRDRPPPSASLRDAFLRAIVAWCARRGNRTHTVSPPPDFESGAR